MMDTSLWFLFISLGISLIYSLYKLFPFSQNARLPPGPAKLPIVGNLFDLDQNRLHVSLANLAKSYGPIMSLKLGLTTTIVISSPEAAQDVLQTKDVFFSARSIPDAFYAYNFNNRSVLWLPSTSPLWKQLRATCSMYLFSPRCLEFTRQMREKKAQDIMQHFRRLANHPVDIGPVVFAGMLNIISNLVFSEDVVDLNSESKQEFKDLITSSVHESIKPNISDLFPFLRLLDLQGRRRGLTGYLERIYNFFDDVIDHRVKCVNVGGKRNNDFLDSLLKLNAESKLDRQTMKVLLTEIFVAGTDTSSITVVWAMAELLHDPVALAKVQHEVRHNFQSEVPNELDITKLPYLQAVLKETMRMHPAGPLGVPHKAMEAVVDLGGRFMVPKGARVFINIWAIGRDPKVWDEPNVFRPERFLEKEIEFRGKDFEFIPFGFGRRICPGMPLATRVVPYILALLLHEFDWKLPDGMGPKDVDLTEKFLAALELAVPLHVIPVPRVN
ncbi:hypothetical protein LUZ60_002812 [Juncus effusus]|nr:hypothetical protein LUZ60_002812 [Juncus effusus]